LASAFAGDNERMEREAIAIVHGGLYVLCSQHVQKGLPLAFRLGSSLKVLMNSVADVDLPNVKQTLWHQAHADLSLFIPGFSHEFLLCPTCFRQMRFDELSIEHIIPRQAVDRDPKDVREAMRAIKGADLLFCAINH
jgi:hypothetical protein